MVYRTFKQLLELEETQNQRGANDQIKLQRESNGRYFHTKSDGFQPTSVSSAPDGKYHSSRCQSVGRFRGTGCDC